jgi:hypothetical protein
MAKAIARNSGSARDTAATAKFGTKMQAKGMMNQWPVVSGQLPVGFFCQLGTGN